MEKNRVWFKIASNVLLYLLVISSVIWLLPQAIFFFSPFLVAWVISSIATPIVKWVERKLRLKRKASFAVVIILILASLIGIFYFLVSQVLLYIGNFLKDFPVLWEDILHTLDRAYLSIEYMLSSFPEDVLLTIDDFVNHLGEYLGEFVSEFSEPTIEAVGNFAGRVPDIIVYTIMCVLASYFFVADREKIAESIYRIMPKVFEARYLLIKNTLAKSIGGYFKAQFKIEVWVYLVITLGLMILKVEYAPLIAVVIAFLDLLPVFGTGAVLWPWALFQALSGDYFEAVGLMIVWGFSQLLRQIIQPKFVGDSLGMAPVPTLVLLFVGYRMWGVLGMIVAVPIGILLVNLYKEGVFETAETSFRIAIMRWDRFRKFDENEKKELEINQKKEEK